MALSVLAHTAGQSVIDVDQLLLGISLQKQFLRPF